MIDARISGTKKELEEISSVLRSVDGIDGISRFYKNRDSISLGRVYFKIDMDKIRNYLPNNGVNKNENS